MMMASAEPYSVSGALLSGSYRYDGGEWEAADDAVDSTPERLPSAFGSGEIASFDPDNGKFKGLLRGRHGHPLEIEGLWALRFGNGANAGSLTTLFFTAGIDDEAHGLFGSITPLDGRDDDDNRDDRGDHDDGH